MEDNPFLDVDIENLLAYLNQKFVVLRSIAYEENLRKLAIDIGQNGSSMNTWTA